MARRRSNLTKKQKERLKQLALWGGLGWLTWEGWSAMVLHRQRRRDGFNAALNAKAELDRPLVVLGDPQGGWLGRILGPDFDCADLCIDARGCANCPNVVVASPEEGLQQLGDSSHIVFVNTGVFERTANPDLLAAEIRRVSGGAFYMAPFSPWTAFAWLPPSKRRVLKYPPAAAAGELSWKGWGGEAGDLQSLQLAGIPRLRLIYGRRR